jgi:hypothetical protein
MDVLLPAVFGFVGGFVGSVVTRYLIDRRAKR